MHSIITRFTLAALSFLASGCGLVFQGFTQNLVLDSDPHGAQVSFHGASGISPQNAAISRRHIGLYVYRVEKPGYLPACQVVDCTTPKWIKVLDSIPAAVPLLLDFAAGSLANCAVPTLTLDPIRDDAMVFTLPPDAELLKIGRGACSHPYIYDPEFQARAERILVSTGPLPRASRSLGNVDFGKTGFDHVSSGVWRIDHTFAQATPGELNELMRMRALRMYGSEVDAVINVDYQDNPRHDVYATGVAVHFTDSDSPGAASANRLEALRGLRERGLIDQHEYEVKRAEILKDL